MGLINRSEYWHTITESSRSDYFTSLYKKRVKDSTSIFFPWSKTFNLEQDPVDVFKEDKAGKCRQNI